MRSFVYAAIAALVVLLNPAASNALCVCQCSNGHLLPLCSNPLDIPPICPATGCSMVPATVIPPSPPPVTVMPAPPRYAYPQPQPYYGPVYGPGQPYCRTVRVCDPYGFCRLRELCG